MPHELGINEVQPRGSNKMNLLDEARHCTEESCETAANIILECKPYCLEHFIVHCYELLDRLDPRIRGKHSESQELSQLKGSVEECSNRALIISLRFERLTNIDRSRLLDILLWSSDLLFLLNISPHDFDLLRAFRLDSEGCSSLETAPAQPARTQFHGKPAGHS
jgi:hypothetical protein